MHTSFQDGFANKDAVSSIMATIEESRRHGRALRAEVKRSSLGTGLDFDRDPLQILRSQNRVRIRELVPVRMGRMAQSPFTFFRGAAAVMAHDLATTPVTGITVQACGDAHLSNFGLFASPERRLIFDLNDFDETLPGPWEWDVERLFASLAIAAQANGLSDAKAGDAVAIAAAEYRESIARLAGTGALSRFHMMLTAEMLMRRLRARSIRNPGRGGMVQRLRKAVEKARLRTSEQALAKLSVTDKRGIPQIVDQPPLIVHRDRVPDDVPRILKDYRVSAHHDVNALLEHFTLVDFALKVVGVGSVGTHCYVALVMCATAEPLFLQIKQATASVLEPYTQRSVLRHHGRRVVAGQQIMQAATDPFLGWATAGKHHFYIRQFRDMKGSVAVEKLNATGLTEYGRLCAGALARAHAQTSEPALLAGYLGGGQAFDAAMVKFALDYAKQNESDHAALLRAIKNGRVPANPGV
jgi:uncharacterized protein (DUF2252 family)